jgi:hypothetical protein
VIIQNKNPGFGIKCSTGEIGVIAAGTDEARGRASRFA